jgi:adenylate cyclase
VYEPVGFGAGSDDGLAEQFAAALAHFEIGRWLDARRAFAAILARFPNDGPSAYYAALSDQYASQPPPTWAGAVSVATK